MALDFSRNLVRERYITAATIVVVKLNSQTRGFLGQEKFNSNPLSSDLLLVIVALISSCGTTT